MALLKIADWRNWPTYTEDLDDEPTRGTRGKCHVTSTWNDVVAFWRQRANALLMDDATCGAAWACQVGCAGYGLQQFCDAQRGLTPAIGRELP